MCKLSVGYKPSFPNSATIAASATQQFIYKFVE